MKHLVLSLLVFSSSAFAFDIDLSNSKPAVASTHTLQVAIVTLSGMKTPVNVELQWNAVSNVFEMTRMWQNPAPVNDFTGIWTFKSQPSCTGAWMDYTTIEYDQDGTCKDRGLKCTWTSANGMLNMKWTDYPDYDINVNMVNGELDGTIVQSTNKWCIHAVRSGNLIETLSMTPNYNAVPFVH